MSDLGAVKCANGHTYYGVDCGPCPLCGWHRRLSDDQRKEFGPQNHILTSEQLVAILRGDRSREVSPVAQRAVSECYVPHGGNVAYLDKMVECAAHLHDSIQELQEQILSEKRW